mmetsp:Transcript_39634/g.53888  ORF Transcript_39634/g.53888 Transcript_39634/m.53888 type:complete len:97 (-) Transcript_39634:451-741(-)|eukprot:CAMPEP_0185772298 /NCGR_PEP_ID=MMETSP1174-20130828/68199_1 /TAXON_ID=35687 /ORGANISM="Dictyocha speculum, Strain CCMP1381" /LENGTH=96 /DNA_ID=CAMNT_0028458495 /DNA_START=52 /DNA_END=342 /DNA_ORIENTATION=+
MPGGISTTREPTGPEDAIYGAISDKVLEALELGSTDDFEVISYTTQVVAGTRHKLKIKVGDEFWHCEIMKPLPHTGNSPFIFDGSISKGLALDTPL